MEIYEEGVHLEEVTFHGETYLYVQGDDKIGDGLTSKEDFENYEVGFAYITKRGKVMRFGTCIGKASDITHTGKMVMCKPSPEGMFRAMMFGRLCDLLGLPEGEDV